MNEPAREIEEDYDLGEEDGGVDQQKEHDFEVVQDEQIFEDGAEKLPDIDPPTKDFHYYSGQLYSLYQAFAIKNVLHFLANSKNPGAIGRILSSVGVVASTTTACIYYPSVAYTGAMILCGIYVADTAINKPENQGKLTKASIGAALLALNYISPLIFDPRENLALFTTYLYFSLYSFDCVSATEEKTQNLLNLYNMTGFNLLNRFQNPLVYLGALNILAAGHADEVINQKLDANHAHFSWYGKVIDYAARDTLLNKLKEFARESSTNYLISICDNVSAKFVYLINLPAWAYNEYKQPKVCIEK